MNRRLSLFLLFVCILSWCFGQQGLNPTIQQKTESIISLESKGADSQTLLLAYEELALSLVAEKQYKDALPWILKGLDIAEGENLEDQTFTLLHLAGFIFYYPLDSYEQSLDYLQRANALAESLTVSPIYHLRNRNKLAEVLFFTGQIKEALELQFDTNILAEDREDLLSLAVGLRNLGVFYFGQSQFQSANQFFDQSLATIHQIDPQGIRDPILQWDLSLTYYNIVASQSGVHNAFSQDGDNDELRLAISKAERARTIADSIGHVYGVAFSQGLKGQIYATQQEPDSALKYLESAVSLYKEMGLKREWVSFSVIVVSQLLAINNPYRALRWLEESVQTAEEINAPDILRDMYSIQAVVYEKLENIPRAYEAYKNYIVYKDSLAKGKDAMAAMEPQQKVRDQQATIEDLTEQKEVSRRQLLAAIFIFGLIILLIMLYLGYVRNKTLRRINRVLSTKNDEIRRQNERLASSNEDLQQFAHVVSHDLREPLRSIGSFATLLQRRYQGRIDHDADEFISFITAGVSRMDTLLSDLMAYSVVGIFQHELEAVNVNDVIQGIITNITRERGSLGARFNVRNLPTIEADRKQISQLFHHLIDNAVKFRSDDPPEIAIEAIQQGSYYLFSVKDNGIGMDEAYRDRIFGLFLRLHNKRSKYKGTGIGLSICKKIVEQHKGKIWIDSQIGVGTTVYFTLPQSPRDELNLDRNFFPRLVEHTDN